MRVMAQFDNDMHFDLSPDVFKMLTQMGDLFTTKVVNEEYYIKKMQKRIDAAKYCGKASILQRINIID
jgi:hypothetical protein